MNPISINTKSVEYHKFCEGLKNSISGDFGKYWLPLVANAVPINEPIELFLTIVAMGIFQEPHNLNTDKLMKTIKDFRFRLIEDKTNSFMENLGKLIANGTDKQYVENIRTEFFNMNFTDKLSTIFTNPTDLSLDDCVKYSLLPNAKNLHEEIKKMGSFDAKKLLESVKQFRRHHDIDSEKPSSFINELSILLGLAPTQEKIDRIDNLYGNLSIFFVSNTLNKMFINQIAEKALLDKPQELYTTLESAGLFGENYTVQTNPLIKELDKFRTESGIKLNYCFLVEFKQLIRNNQQGDSEEKQTLTMELDFHERIAKFIGHIHPIPNQQFSIYAKFAKKESAVSLYDSLKNEFNSNSFTAEKKQQFLDEVKLFRDKSFYNVDETDAFIKELLNLINAGNPA